MKIRQGADDGEFGRGPPEATESDLVATSLGGPVLCSSLHRLNDAVGHARRS